MIAHSQACWLVILASLVTILLHFLSCNHTVRIWDGVKLWLIAPWLCLLGMSHVEAVGMLLGPEGGRSRVKGSSMESSGSEGPKPVFFHSGGLLVYCSAVAAWFSTGIICHPIKTGLHWYTQSGSQWACYVLARMGKIRGKRKIGRCGERGSICEYLVCTTKESEEKKM